jgi:hypothetical protein
VVEIGRSLKEVERRAYRSMFSDGIYDIQFGLIFLAFVLIAILEVNGMFHFAGYALLLIPLIVPWLGKRYITIPRMGEVEFGEKRKKRKLVTLIVAAVVLFLTLPLIIMVVKQSPSGVLGWKLIAIIAAPVFVLAVYTTDFPRLYIYAALLFVSVIEAEFLLDYVGTPLNAVLSFGIPGVVIIAFGINLLIKFIRTHPRMEIEHAE